MKPGLAILLAAAASAVISLAGCGGGAADSTIVTAANESKFSRDAVILAGRESRSPWISAALAAEIDADLRRIRAFAPDVADIGCRPDHVRPEITLAVRAEAPWMAAWRAGEMETGVSGVDRLLSEFCATRVRRVMSGADREWFAIQFAQSLNTRALGERFKAASAHVLGADTAAQAGDGNRLERKAGPPRAYTFSRGWGDCAAGCTRRHFWEITIQADGSIALREYGDALQAALPQTGRCV